MLFLALAEIRRNVGRFCVLVAAITMLVFLILFQQSLKNGLVTSFVGAIRNQSAPILVYSIDGQRVIQSSSITPSLEKAVRSHDAIESIGRIGQGTFTVRAGQHRFDTTILGFEKRNLGAPTDLVAGRYPNRGEAVGSESDSSEGFGIGDVVVVEPGGLQIKIVGIAKEVQLNAGPTLFTPYETYEDAVSAVNPDAGTPLPNVLAIAPADNVSPAVVVDQVNAISPDLDALERDAAADNTPGVSQVQQSFQVILLLYGLVIPCVVGLFFLIITFQKSRALTLLRAIGAPPRRLVASLLIQAVAVTSAGFVLGVALYWPLSTRRLGGIPLKFEATAVFAWAIVLLVLGVGSSLVAARRVLAIDPIEAATGGASR